MNVLIKGNPLSPNSTIPIFGKRLSYVLASSISKRTTLGTIEEGGIRSGEKVVLKMGYGQFGQTILPQEDRFLARE